MPLVNGTIAFFSWLQHSPALARPAKLRLRAPPPSVEAMISNFTSMEVRPSGSTWTFFSSPAFLMRVAMRHSSKTQASAAYDKGASDRRVSAAMKVAADLSATFKAPIFNKEGKKRAR